MKKSKLKINLVVAVQLFVVCVFAACSVRPSSVLSDERMESVLYDLYLAEAIIDDNYFVFNEDSIAKQNLLNSVFEKHKIDEQTFDTSLVWYNANIDKYLKINGRVGERLSLWADNLKNRQNQMEEERRRAEFRNFFPRDVSFFLQSPGFFQNRYEFQTDSIQLQAILSYNLSFSVLGIRDSIYPVLSFCIQTADTIFTNSDTIRVNGLYSNSFSVPEGSEVKEIYGSLSISDDEKALILFHDAVLQKQENAIVPAIQKQETDKIDNKPRHLLSKRRKYSH